MKIWLINHYATNMFDDRAGRHYWFAQKLSEHGHSVTVICATTFLNGDRTIDTEGKKYKIERIDDISFVFVKTTPSKGNGIARIRNWVLFYRNLFPVTKDIALQSGKPNVIVASSVHPLTMVAGIQIGRRIGVPCICEVRDLWPEAIFQFGKSKEKSLIGRILVSGEHWIYRKADALVFTKEGDTDYLKEKRWTTAQGGDVDLRKCHYINNGIDISAFRERMEKNIPDDIDLNDESKFNVIYAGTIRPVNNVGNLLDAASIFKGKENYEDVQFLIYGDGDQLPALKKRVEDEHLDNVKLKGFINRRFIPYILSKSSVNILNYAQSQYNWTRGNSSNKLFEYMASGKPIISTVRMGYSIIKRYRCGTELDKDTPETLADEIMRYHDMSEDERRMIGQNAQNGAKDFDFDLLTDKLLRVIEEVV